MTNWFNPDSIRSDIESTFTNMYYPAAYSAATSYVAGNRVRRNGIVYEANQSVAGVVPPASQWNTIGSACKVLYQNVPSTLDTISMRIELSWGRTTNESSYSTEGRLRRVDGAMGVWIFTPKGQGSSSSLQIASRVRQTMFLWNRLGTCGEQVMIYDVNGPRSVDSVAEDTHFLQILSASLMVLEKAQ